jgi:elongation factor Ts
LAHTSVEAIKALREVTGAGIMDCKQALEEVGGDRDKAVELLRKKGFAVAAKKAARETKQGVVDAYIHSGSRIGAMVELNCETDFVARTPEFRQLAHDIALQVAAMSPAYVSAEEVPPTDNVNPEERCLLQQPFIKDPTRTVQDIVNEAIAKTGENIKVRRFVRFALGE